MPLRLPRSWGICVCGRGAGADHIIIVVGVHLWVKGGTGLGLGGQVGCADHDGGRGWVGRGRPGSYPSVRVLPSSPGQEPWGHTGSLVPKTISCAQWDLGRGLLVGLASLRKRGPVQFRWGWFPRSI